MNADIRCLFRLTPSSPTRGNFFILGTGHTSPLPEKVLELVSGCRYAVSECYGYDPQCPDKLLGAIHELPGGLAIINQVNRLPPHIRSCLEITNFETTLSYRSLCFILGTLAVMASGIDAQLAKFFKDQNFPVFNIEPIEEVLQLYTEPDSLLYEFHLAYYREQHDQNFWREKCDEKLRKLCDQRSNPIFVKPGGLLKNPEAYKFSQRDPKFQERTRLIIQSQDEGRDCLIYCGDTHVPALLSSLLQEHPGRLERWHSGRWLGTSLEVDKVLRSARQYVCGSPTWPLPIIRNIGLLPVALPNKNTILNLLRYSDFEMSQISNLNWQHEKYKQEKNEYRGTNFPNFDFWRQFRGLPDEKLMINQIAYLLSGSVASNFLHRMIRIRDFAVVT